MTATCVGWADPPALPEVAEVVRYFNESNRAHQSLWERVRQAGDIVSRADQLHRDAVGFAGQERAAHLAVQAEHPERRAPFARQLAIAGLTVALDAVACWFAAQAVGDNQLQTLVWAGLFLAVLATGEVALDYYRDRSMRAWRLVLAGLAAFVVGLGVLRYLFLSTVGVTGSEAALVGAVLFTAATACFLVFGYRALRAAEKAAAWKARLAVRRADRLVDQTAVQLTGFVDDQHRLVNAYLSRIRVTLLGICNSSQLDHMEDALRKHLCGSGSS